MDHPWIVACAIYPGCLWGEIRPFFVTHRGQGLKLEAWIGNLRIFYVIAVFFATVRHQLSSARFLPFYRSPSQNDGNGPIDHSRWLDCIAICFAEANTFDVLAASTSKSPTSSQTRISDLGLLCNCTHSSVIRNAVLRSFVLSERQAWSG